MRIGLTKKGTPVELSPLERQQGTYIVGTTGTGKTTLLKNMIYQDMADPDKPGLCVLDPHGDLVDDLLKIVPKDRISDVVLFDATDTDYPFGLNLLACDKKNPEEVRWMVSTVVGTLRRIFYYSWGPLLEHVLRNALLTTLILPNPTLLDLVEILLLSPQTDKNSKGTLEKMQNLVTDPILKQFWETFPRSERLRYELVSSTLNKISPFTTDALLRNIVGQRDNTINLEEIMTGSKILFVNISKGHLGEDASSLLGSIVVNLILMSALKRQAQSREERRVFHLYVDEYQNFATESFSILQSEARKFAIDVTVAHQYRDQLDIPSKGASLNVGNLIAFRVSGKDSYEIASQFDNTPPSPETRVEPVYQAFDYQGLATLIPVHLNTGEGTLYQEVELPRRPYNDVEAEMANRLSILPNFHAWCRLINSGEEHGQVIAERYLITDPIESVLGENISLNAVDQIRLNSREKTRSRAIVEEDLQNREGINTLLGG